MCQFIIMISILLNTIKHQLDINKVNRKIKYFFYFQLLIPSRIHISFQFTQMARGLSKKEIRKQIKKQISWIPIHILFVIDRRTNWRTDDQGQFNIPPPLEGGYLLSHQVLLFTITIQNTSRSQTINAKFQHIRTENALNK